MNSASSCTDLTLKLRDILKSNKIMDPISDFIIHDSALKGENMTSKVNWVTVTFENDVRAPLNLFLKRQTENSSNTGMVTESKLFEKESIFFMEYLPQARKFCEKFG